MRLQPENAILVLWKNLPLRLAGARGATIRCDSGIVWLTIDGEPGDFFLTAGESHTLASNGLALIEAIESGTIRIVLPRPSSRLEGLLRLADPLVQYCSA